MKKSMQRLTSVILAGIISLTPNTLFRVNAEDMTEEQPIMKFQLLSDVHVSKSWDIESGYANSVNNFIDGMNDIKEFAPDSSALVIAGDYGGDGSETETKDFFELLEQYNTIPNPIIAAGNHDYAWVPTWEEFSERYLRFNAKYMETSSEKVYFDKWIDGYHFITLNTEAKANPKETAYFSNEQLSWLREKLSEGANLGKPIFVIVHQPLKGTFPRSNEWSVGEQDEELKEILKDFPQVVLLSGHIHNGFGVAPIMETQYGTLVDTPSFAYNENGLEQGQVGYQIEVFSDKIVFRARDYKNDQWLTQYDKTIALKQQSVAEKARQELLSLYNQNVTRQKEDYPIERWNDFENAMNEAKALLDSNSLNENNLNLMLQSLNQAIELLAFSDEFLISTASNNCTATATSSWWSWASGLDDRYLPEKILDGDYGTSWASDSFFQSSEADPRPTATLTWEKTQTVKAMLLYNRPGNPAWNEISVFFNGNEEEIIKVNLPADNTTPTVVNLPEAKENVTSISIAFENGAPGGSGLSEVKVYQNLLEEKQIVSFEEINVETLVGTIPTLPPQIKAVYNDGSVAMVNVQWEEISEDNVQKEGVFTVNGNVENTDLKVTATISVKALPIKADYSEVDAVIAEAEKLVKDLYTTESWTNLQNAINTVVKDLTDQDTVDGFVSAITEAVKALVRAPEKKIFTITVNGTSTEYAYNEAVTVKAPEEKDGVNFAYWENEDGIVVSNNAVYKFYASQDMTLTAVYKNEVVKTATAMLTNVFVTKRDDGKSNMKFVGELALPEGYTVLEAGLVWSSKDETELLADDGKNLNSKLKPTYISKISDTNQFSVTIKGIPADRFLRGVIFAKVADEDGNEGYIFSGEKKIYAAK